MFNPELIVDPTEKRSFSYFNHETRPQLQSFVDHDFWDQLVLQGSHNGAAVRQVVVAIGAFHEYIETIDPAMRVARHNTFSSLHQRAIARTVTELPMMPIADVLIASILLAFLDNVRGNMLGAYKHISGAAAIVNEYRGSDSTRCRSILVSRVLGPIIDKLDSMVQTIYAPIPVHLLGPASGKPFVNFLDAHDQLHATTESLSAQLKSNSLTLQDFTYPNQFDIWWAKFQYFTQIKKGARCKCPWPENHAHYALGTLFLETVYLGARARFHSALTGLETTLDLYEYDFRRVLDACEQMVQITKSSPESIGSSTRACLGFRPVYFMSIWMVLGGCRDPYLRRRALDIMRLRREINGVWDTFVVADTAEGFIAFEENRSPIQPVTCAADIPEESRCNFLCAVGFKVDAKTGDLRLESYYPQSDLLKLIALRRSPSYLHSSVNNGAVEPEVIFDAFWLGRTPAGSFIPIAAEDVPGALSKELPMAIGGLFPQASTKSPSTPRSASTKLWSMLDDTRTAQEHLNEWRYRLAHPPFDRVPQATDVCARSNDEDLEERVMGIQLRTIHTG